jgi:hypothetical protein
VDKTRARLNCIHHLLSLVPYKAIDKRAPVLPSPAGNAHHIRVPISGAINVPMVY